MINEEYQKEEATEQAITIRRTDGVRRREAFVGWSQVVANIVVPITLVLAVWGFQLDVDRQRVSASDRQVELFHSSSISDARLILFELWSDVDVWVLSEPQTREFIDHFVFTVIEADPDIQRDVNAAIISIASFFDGVETCIQRERCDDEELLAQIGRYGRDFFCLYEGQLVMARDESLLFGVGEGLGQFAERAGGCAS
ncbi:MAG: hypothetical protein AAGI44_14555 [Pseudomonadota bacterium]